jgi:imidazoleglycerol-phosphate dehydratase
MGRSALIERNTKETKIKVDLALDGQGRLDIDTGLGFFDHMLTHVGFHGFFDLTIKARGDLEVDQHHTVEDVGICLGQAFAQALGDKKGIFRYGHAFVPMDEALARVVLDFSNRPIVVVTGQDFPGEPGGFGLQLAKEFWRAFSLHAGVTLHVDLCYGENDHHILEAAFKALGRALDQAVSLDPRNKGVASTKGVL